MNRELIITPCRLAIYTLATTCLISLFAPPAEARQEFSYYKYILERHPFGKPPPAPDPNAAASAAVVEPPPAPPKPTPPWVASLKLVAIIEPDDEDESLRVGLFDQKEKKSYFINLGETYTYHVFDADYVEEKALVGLDDRKFWLFMDGRPPYEYGMEPEGDDAGASVSGQARPARVAAAPTRPRRRTARRVQRSEEELEAIRKSLPPPVSSALATARARGKALPEMEPEDMEAYLREYQMELIRAKGEMGPALPIPLTPEMDAQLVDEGVLPPLE